MSMNSLIPEDLNYVVNRLPRDVKKLMKDKGVYLAGGFIRSCIAGEKINDIDLWGQDKEQLEVIAALFAGERKVRMMNTDNACTIITPGRSEDTSELQSLMRISYAVFCLKKKNTS